MVFKLSKEQQKKHLLFICASGTDRSPCAVSFFESSDKYEAKSCGVSSPITEFPITDEAVKWADLFIVMDERNKQDFTAKYPEIDNKKVILLDISSDFKRYDNEMMKLMKTKLKQECLL
mgnify:CR=1 FL=1